MKILSADGHEESVLLPKVTGVKPCGSLVLVELLTVQEIMGTVIHVGDGANTDGVALQGWIREVGPTVKEDDWGFKIGDRIVLSGGAIPAPKFSKTSNRKFVLMDPTSIKAVVED